jgi:hypothetical protein
LTDFHNNEFCIHTILKKIQLTTLNTLFQIVEEIFSIDRTDLTISLKAPKVVAKSKGLSKSESAILRIGVNRSEKCEQCK